VRGAPNQSCVRLRANIPTKRKAKLSSKAVTSVTLLVGVGRSPLRLQRLQ
jgi:hypothetical protein